MLIVVECVCVWFLRTGIILSCSSLNCLKVPCYVRAWGAIECCAIAIASIHLNGIQCKTITRV